MCTGRKENRYSPDHGGCEKGLGQVTRQTVTSHVVADTRYVFEQKGFSAHLNKTGDDTGDELSKECRSWGKLHVVTQLHILHEDQTLVHDLKRKRF
jgi:hypothetical protein